MGLKYSDEIDATLYDKTQHWHSIYSDINGWRYMQEAVLADL